VAISSRAERIAPGPENTPGFTYPVCSNCAYKRYWSQPTEAGLRAHMAKLAYLSSKARGRKTSGHFEQR
jgi:hypothetical protein